MRRGFVLGKFMPPHAGHLHLCQTARDLVDELTILVCWLPDDPIPGPLRLAWMQALFPTCRVIGHDRVAPQEPKDHPDFWSIWRGIVVTVHPEPIDFVFAGEGYGLRLAEEVNAQFVPVGPRLHPELSGTAVRADPWKHWDQLTPPVRSYYAKVICLHGPESTGKSTLAPRLADHYGTLWVPEYGRLHCDTFGFDLDADDLVRIARVQTAMIRAARAACNRRLVVDTDALMTAAWSLMLLGYVPDEVAECIDPATLYVVTDTDIAWSDDGTRYFPEPADRERFMAACLRVLEQTDARWVRVAGTTDHRLRQAITAVGRVA